MSSSVTVDMSHQFDRELKSLERERCQQLIRRWNGMFETLSRGYSGKPAFTIKPALQRASRRLGGSLSEQELTEHSTLISEGTESKVKAKSR